VYKRKPDSSGILHNHSVWTDNLADLRLNCWDGRDIRYW